MAGSVKRACKSIIGMRHFSIFRRVGQRLKSTDRYPVLITGKIDILCQNIVRFQVIADAVQLLSCRDLPRIFRGSGASGKLHVFLCALPGRLRRFLSGLSGLLHRFSRLLDRFGRLCFLPGISISFRRIVFGFRRRSCSSAAAQGSHKKHHSKD